MLLSRLPTPAHWGGDTSAQCPSDQQCPPNTDPCLSPLLDGWSPDGAGDVKDVCTLGHSIGTCEVAFHCEPARDG